MADTQTRLEALMAKMAKLEAEITDEKSKAEAEAAIGTIGADVADFIQRQALKVKVDVKVLHGKFFALTVGEDGKLAVALASKANGNGKAHSTTTTPTSGTTNGEYEYFLKDGRGPYPDIQAAMDVMGVDKAKRPTHNRYGRLSKEWQAKIDRKVKATEPAATEPATQETQSA